jgi:3alpha(or 20beta)-hydroxysteroid dehydrogenase
VSSKWAVRGLSKTAAIDLGPFGIRVNSVHPGGIATPMTGGGYEQSGWVKKLPIPRWGQPDDVANVVTFLASDEAAYVTGAEWSVDGGATSGDRGIFE